MNSDELSSARSSVLWEAFEEVFRDSGAVRVNLDWEKAKSFPVGFEYSDLADLGSWYTVWYTKMGLNGDILESFYDDPEASPATVTYVSKMIKANTVTFSQSEAVNAMVEENRDTGQGNLLIPAWRTPGGATIILDGNHSAVSATITEVPMKVLAFVVYGAADPLYLPDLVHHR